MGNRETILQAVASNKPDLLALPDMDFSLTIQYPDLLDQFITPVDMKPPSGFWDLINCDRPSVRVVK